MDLRLIDAPLLRSERAAADTVLGPEPAEPVVAEEPARRELLLPALWAVQERLGWVSEAALGYLCRRLHVPPAEAFGVATFYRMISLAPRAPAVAYVCEDLACRMKGSLDLCRGLEQRLGPPGGGGGERSATWERSACLGLCDRAPSVLVCRADPEPTETTVHSGDAGELLTALETERLSPPPHEKVPQFGDSGLRLLRRIGRIDPESLDDYRAQGGYRALDRALEIGPEAIIREVAASRLLGRGGAAFPTARKWEAVAGAPVTPHYLVCNADESEPGTFKDRILLDEDPFALIEAMTLAAFATGCGRGYVYVRGEYLLAARRVAGAAERARAAGLLGANIRGRGFSFDIEIRRGAGAYICGEETALFNSIEGFRGEPRSKPPFPTTAGLFGKPTVVNNVETLVNVLDIILDGGAAFAAGGTKESTGTRLFCVSGGVRVPGLYEVPLGTPLARLLEIAGGPPEGRSFQAVLLGGAAGTFLAPKEFDVPLSFEGTRAVGATLGSGAVIAFDDSADLKDAVRRIAAFFREESCGQCVPCRIGTVRQEEILERLGNGSGARATKKDLELLREVAQAMRDASICGLGQTAAAAVQSALTRFRLAGGGGR